MEALRHAGLAHHGQKDRCGSDYLLHPIAVAQAIRLDPALRRPTPRPLMSPIEIEEAEVVALLHDVLEDTEYRIPSEELTGQESRALIAITRQTERKPHPEPYAEYIARVSTDRLASFVKLADLWHNLRPERQACLPSQERESLERRYLDARNVIWAAQGHQWWPSGEQG